MKINKVKANTVKVAALFFAVLIVAAGCKPKCDTSNVSYNDNNSITEIITANCYPCHEATSAQGGLILEYYDVVKGVVKDKRLVNAINHNPGYIPMPLNGKKITQCEIDKIQAWIRSGFYETKPLTKVFIQPFESCQAPARGDRLSSEDNLVCTNEAISGSTEEGREFKDYGNCDVVRTQRPYYPKDPYNEADPRDKRLRDKTFMTELDWINSQIRSSACVCCHDSKVSLDGKFALWNISARGIWTDQLGTQGLGILSGKISSEILGKYPAAMNNGFNRDSTGFPSTDPARVQQFFNNEIVRRGLTDADFAALPPFGSFILDIINKQPDNCTSQEYVQVDGKIYWTGGNARYVYVKEPGSGNPGVPPSNDNPEGVLWRLDVLANVEALAPGIVYGALPAGTYQVTPAENAAPPALISGQRYHLYVLKDILQPKCNCIFTAP